MVKQKGTIPDYLCRKDLADPVIAAYLDAYDKLAAQDIATPLVDEKYVEEQARNLVAMVRAPHSGRLADIGSGKGFLVRGLLHQGAKDVTAVDIALPYLERLAKLPGVSAVRANSENLPFKDEFDVIVSTDVMEHVLNLGSFLFCINRALKPGGMLYLRVPLRENLLGYSPHLGCPHPFAHLRSFDEMSLGDCLEGAGFRVLGSRKDGFLLGMPQAFWEAGDRRKSLYNRMQKLIAPRMPHFSDTASWNPYLAGLLMKPNFISVEARKTHEIKTGEPGGWSLCLVNRA
ncbi:MAG: methyltransferase domain-containing protein [Thermodesulfobacteriota bacterium]